MFTKIKNFIKIHQSTILLIIGIILISLLSFAIGFILAKQQSKEPIKFEYESSDYWRGSLWFIFKLEIG
jgi:hypothetical protein